MTHDPEITDPGVAMGDNVHVEVYDARDLREKYTPEWDRLSRRERRDRVRAEAPLHSEQSTQNTTCIPLLQQIAKLLNFRNGAERVRDPPTELALGDDWGGGASPDSTVFSTYDEQLNNEVGRVPITDPSDSGRSFRVDEYVGTQELNGETLRELGIVLESGALANHAPLSQEIQKTSDEAVAIGVDIPISNTELSP